MNIPGKGGGGGALEYLGGGGSVYARYQNKKNTPKVLISGQKSSLILIKNVCVRAYIRTYIHNTKLPLKY